MPGRDCKTGRRHGGDRGLKGVQSCMADSHGVGRVPLKVRACPRTEVGREGRGAGLLKVQVP